MSRRTVFFVSDQTGVTAETLGHSLMTQFEGLEFRPVTLPFVSSLDKAEEAVRRIDRAALEEGLRPIVFVQRGSSLAPIADLAFEPPILVLEPVKLEGATDDQPQLVDIDRLLVEIISAGRDGAKRAFPSAMARGDDDLGFGLELEDILERGEALGV